MRRSHFFPESPGKVTMDTGFPLIIGMFAHLLRRQPDKGSTMRLHRSSVAALSATALLAIVYAAPTLAADTPPSNPPSTPPSAPAPAPAPDSGDGKDKGTKLREIEATATEGYHRGYE